MSKSLQIALVVLLFAGAHVGHAQTAGKLERIKVASPSLAGNLQGNPTDRDVVVYLPPAYQADSGRRFPVLYQLHGWLPSAEVWSQMIDLEQGANAAIANGSAKEMIIVVPDALTIFEGSMYSTSVTTGDFEGFIVRDLVEYIDAHYRTIPERASRGLSGHSMGGYGTLRIGMKHPDVFGALFAMSSCCLMNQAPSREVVEQQIERTAGGAPAGRGFGNVILAQAAAWAPNPQKPPLYLDWPYENGEFVPQVAAKWAANSPLVFVDQYVQSLRSYRAIYVDVGDADSLLATNEQLNESLERLGVGHEFEVYEGDHGNRVAQRFRENVLPFFSEHLD